MQLTTAAAQQNCRNGAIHLGYFFMARKPRLTVVNDPGATAVDPDATAPEPPRKLGDHGRALWDRVTSEYDIADSGGAEMLTLACQSLDRAESLRIQIDADGEVIRGRGGTLDGRVSAIVFC
jgi:hypothetical protein